MASRVRNAVNALRGRETRDSGGGYTDIVLERLVENVGAVGAVSVLAAPAVEIAAGAWSRSLAAAEVEGGPLARSLLTPALLADIGRDLAEGGESVLLFRTRPPRLTRSSGWDVHGDADAWTYRVDLSGPSDVMTIRAPMEAVAHPKYATRPVEPWRGLSPLACSPALAKLAASIETRLGAEAAAPSGYVLPLPDDGDVDREDGRLAVFKRDFRNAKGGIVPVPTSASGWTDGKIASPHADWKQSRLGFDPPETLAELRADAVRFALAAYGLHAVLVSETPAGQALVTASRMFVHTTLEPLGRLIADEVGRVLEEDVRLDLSAVTAADLASRSRALGYLVQSGIELADAREAVGI